MCDYALPRVRRWTRPAGHSSIHAEAGGTKRCKKVDKQTPEDADALTRAAAAYLDMWEAVVSEHALNGPVKTPAEQTAPTGDKPR